MVFRRIMRFLGLNFQDEQPFVASDLRIYLQRRITWQYLDGREITFTGDAKDSRWKHIAETVWIEPFLREICQMHFEKGRKYLVVRLINGNRYHNWTVSER